MKIIYLLVLVLSVPFYYSCQGENKNSKKQQEIKKEYPIGFVKDEIVSILTKIDYPTTIQIKGDTILFKGKEEFSEAEEGNTYLVLYVIYQFFSKHPDYLENNIVISFKYRTSKTSQHLRYSPETSQVMAKPKKYWDMIGYALAHFTVYDCVYFDLTLKQVLLHNCNYGFDGSIWRLIAAIANKEKNADIDFLEFYLWSHVRYDDDLSFDPKKLDYYVKDLGFDPKQITREFVDSIRISRRLDRNIRYFLRKSLRNFVTI